jgi:pyruvate,orthophosphate dikinase
VRRRLRGLSIDLDAHTITVGDRTLSEGDLLTIDGGTGAVIVGEVPLVAPEVNDDLETILGWGDQHRTLKVRANADTPEDAAKAREFGAQGIGLCRTEHMFMAEGRLPVVREMILADSEEGRRKALDKLLPMQQGDFESIFEAMTGLPVTIRLLDPPLHEFLPPPEQATDERMRRRIRQLQESNPMLGRGAVSACSGRRSMRCRCARSFAPHARSRSGRVRRPLSRSCIRSSASRRSCAGFASSPCAWPAKKRPRSSTSAGP